MGDSVSLHDVLRTQLPCGHTHDAARSKEHPIGDKNRDLFVFSSTKNEKPTGCKIVLEKIKLTGTEAPLNKTDYLRVTHHNGYGIADGISTHNLFPDVREKKVSLCGTNPSDIMLLDRQASLCWFDPAGEGSATDTMRGASLIPLNESSADIQILGQTNEKKRKRIADLEPNTTVNQSKRIRIYNTSPLRNEVMAKDRTVSRASPGQEIFPSIDGVINRPTLSSIRHIIDQTILPPIQKTASSFRNQTQLPSLDATQLREFIKTS